MSAALRRALRQQQIPEFLALLQAALDLEVGAARAVFDGTKQTLSDWIDAFYPELNEQLARDAGPLVKLFGDAIANAALSEIDAVNVRFDSAALSAQYSQGLADRWTNDSISQLRALLRDESDEEFQEEIDSRLSLWQENRARLTAEREATQAGAAFTKIPFLVAGVERLVWAAGVDACPLCAAMNGRVVSITQPFLAKGDTVDPGGDTTSLVTTQVIGHPPLHGLGGKGGVCDCIVVAG